jgi:hypothetical protein
VEEWTVPLFDFIQYAEEKYPGEARVLMAELEKNFSWLAKDDPVIRMAWMKLCHYKLHVKPHHTTTITLYFATESDSVFVAGAMIEGNEFDPRDEISLLAMVASSITSNPMLRAALVGSGIEARHTPVAEL